MARDYASAFDWAHLRQQKPNGDEIAVIEISDAGAISAGIDRYGDLHLLVPVTEAPPSPLPTDLNGLAVRHQRLSTGQVIDLVSPASHEAVFAALCRAVIEAIVDDQREPWRAVIATIKNWQSAWRPKQPLMDKTVQVGLYGELWLLGEILLPRIGPRAVHIWSGPDRELHDFTGRGLDIEVKTTRRRAAEHEISQLDQLWPRDGKKLLFVSVRVEESIGGNDTVANRIEKIKAQLGGDISAHDAFRQKLYLYGWDDDMTNSGDLVRMNLRASLVFQVDDDFPCICRGIDIPSGVVSIQYTLNLSNLPQMPLAEAIALLQQEL
jgi:hypothetical protein